MFQAGLWDQVLGMEQIGPICFSALSSGGGIWKHNVFVLLSFVLFGNVLLLDVLASAFGLGKREHVALS